MDKMSIKEWASAKDKEYRQTVEHYIKEGIDKKII